MGKLKAALKKNRSTVNLCGDVAGRSDVVNAMLLALLAQAQTLGQQLGAASPIHLSVRTGDGQEACGFVSPGGVSGNVHCPFVQTDSFFDNLRALEKAARRWTNTSPHTQEESDALDEMLAVLERLE